MSDHPFIKFYPSDFLAGTSGLSPAERGIYITLLCLIYENDGPIVRDDARLSRRCGAPKAGFIKAISALIDEGKITQDGDMLSNRRAEKALMDRTNRSQNSTHAANQRWGAQAQKYKQNQKGCDALAMPPQCASDASQKPEPDIREEPKGSLSPAGDPKPFDEIACAVSAYNEAAEAAGWPKVQVLSKSRRAALRARLKEAGGVTGWAEALARAQSSPHLCGQNDRGWRANFDFLTRQSSFAKLMEGNYDPADRNVPRQAASHANPASRAINDALRMGAAQRFGDGGG